MPRYILAAATLLALVAMHQPGHAATIQGPYCLYYSDGSVDCSQPSLKMCRLTTVNRNTIGRCYPNEKYRAPHQGKRKPVRSGKHRQYQR